MGLIELTAQDGRTVAVNPAMIFHVRPANDGQCQIHAASGAMLHVLEDYHQVLTILRSTAEG